MTRSTGRFPSAYRAACPSAEKFNRAEYAPSWYTFDTQILRHSDWRTYMKLISLSVLGVMAVGISGAAPAQTPNPLKKEDTNPPKKTLVPPPKAAMAKETPGIKCETHLSF